MHNENCECEACKNGIEAIRQKEEKMLARYGWYAHLVQDDPNFPTGFNAHTHGVFESFKHLDFQIVYPLDGQIVMDIFHNLINRVKEGETFREDQEYSGIIGHGMKIRFMLVSETGSVPTADDVVLRVILPSKNGSLHAATMDSDLFKLQEIRYYKPDNGQKRPI